MDPEAFFSQLFGGEKFLPLIGQISLGSDMKTALQEDNEEATTTGTDGTQRPKTKKEMTPEERQRKEEKEKKEAAEVRKKECLSFHSRSADHDHYLD